MPSSWVGRAHFEAKGVVTPEVEVFLHETESFLGCVPSRGVRGVGTGRGVVSDDMGDWTRSLKLFKLLEGTCVT